ncbi:MAG: DUF655 domain-containing protein [Candidatus Methanomethylicota archaeon]|jgi:putative nucleotide binding protein|uniref:DUF655 domain-containing protein n=1 Tax=Thermoproteota archaeon TaxID=2056631 RepID=A0A520KGT4_9CREN|nr:MAG: DUF655 domain-containing protein [Candidatus Verstraetearchaeota archaeon]TDA37716.1 MAG: DUF655 domain-containing protein [Candidatus Verstraetearchaeota archaeon]
MTDESTKRYEEYAYVLDYLPYGQLRGAQPFYKREPILQAIGEYYFTLLELVPLPGMNFSIGERVAIGKHERIKIAHVKRRITYEELTQTAKEELENIVEIIVSKNEERFVAFFNNAGPLTTRMHSLELLPGVGKKLMWQIIEERKKTPFSSFEDIQKRLHILDPKKMIVKRIIMELKNEDKYYIFTKPHISK